MKHFPTLLTSYSGKQYENRGCGWRSGKRVCLWCWARGWIGNNILIIWRKPTGAYCVESCQYITLIILKTLKINLMLNYLFSTIIFYIWKEQMLNSSKSNLYPWWFFGYLYDLKVSLQRFSLSELKILHIHTHTYTQIYKFMFQISAFWFQNLCS